MESLSDPSDGLRVVATCYTATYFPHHSLAVRHSEPPCLPSYNVQSHLSQLDVHGYSVWFGVQSHCFVLAFRAIVHFPFVIQSHCSFSIWRSEPPFQFGVQSHGFGSTFRVITLLSLVWRLEPLLAFHLSFRATVHIPFGIQSRCFSSASRVVVSVSAFRVVIFFLFSVFRAISIFSLGVQSHYSFSVLAFRAIIVLSFGVQSHHRFSVLVFRAILILSFGVQSHHHSRFSVQSHHRSQFGVQSPHRFLVFGVQSHHRFSVLAFRAIVVYRFGI